jgi:hypothetical protein
MKLRTTLIALTTATLWATGALAQQVGQTHSPNPNKAQNSNMRTQSGTVPYATKFYLTDRDIFLTPTEVYDVYYFTPGATTEVYVAPSAASMGYPTASTRDSIPPTNTPNPNRVQNNGVPTQR